MKTLGFNVYFNVYEVLETEELDLITIDGLFDYQQLGCIQSVALTVMW